MGDTETKIKFSADMGSLKGIENGVRAAFSPQAVEDFKRRTRELEQELRVLGKEQADLVEKLLQVDKASDAYVKIKDRLRDVKEETKLTTAAFQGLSRAIRDTGDEEEKAARNREALAQRSAKNRSFGAGVLQGAGVSQYIPQENMGQRFAGQVVGSAGHRIAGGVAAPFMMPGIGGMSSMLSAIPLVGGAAAGALQSGAGYFQQAVAYDQSRLGLLPYAGDLGGRLARGRSAAGTKEVADKMFAARIKAVGGKSHGFRPTLGDLLSGSGIPLTQWDKGRPVSSEDVARTESTRGRIAAEAVAENRNRYSERTKKYIKEKSDDAARAVKASAFREGWGGDPFSGIGSALTDMGFAPMEHAGLMSGFFGARGGNILDPGSKGQVVEAGAAQRAYGVGTGLSGGFARMGVAGAGGQGNATLSSAIGTALGQELKGSQIPEFLQTLVAQGREMEQSGVKFNVRNLMDTSNVMSSLGLEGLQASRVSSGLQGAGRRTSSTGVKGPMDVLMMRAAGYNPEQGAEGYARASNRLAGGLDEEMLTNLLGEITGGVQSGSYGSEMQIMLLRRAIGQMGVQVGPEQAKGILDRFHGGEMTVGEGGGSEKDMSPAQMIKEAVSGSSGVGGLAVRAAGIQSQQIGLGKELAPTIIALDNAGRGSVRVLTRFKDELKSAARVVENFVGAVDTASKSLHAPLGALGAGR